MGQNLFQVKENALVFLKTANLNYIKIKASSFILDTAGEDLQLNELIWLLKLSAHQWK